jgi:hypothetical protein
MKNRIDAISLSNQILIQYNRHLSKKIKNLFNKFLDEEVEQQHNNLEFFFNELVDMMKSESVINKEAIDLES